MNWNRIFLIILWGLVLLGLAGAVVFTVTRPETTLPYVYDEERDHLPASTQAAAEDPEMKKEAGNGEKTSLDATGSLPEILDSKAKSHDSGSNHGLRPAPPGGSIKPSHGTEGATPQAQAPAHQKDAAKRELDPNHSQIAVVVSGLGLSHKVTDAAIRRLPAEVTLSFSPYTKKLEGWIALAISYEHEVLIDLPLEPKNFPKNDPGPHTLLVRAESNDNKEKLDWISGRTAQAMGFVAFMGERFVTSARSMKQLFEYLQVRGLFFLDNGSNGESLTPEIAKPLGIAYAVADLVLDNNQLSPAAVDARLAQTERYAAEKGHAIALARPYPLSLERIAQWTEELPSRGFKLVPLSALNAMQLSDPPLTRQRKER